jgi:CRISPR-associated endonuclease/helicase Cas3
VDRNWDPSSKSAVEDLGGRARWQQTRRPTLRLHPALVDDAQWAKAPAPADSDDPDGDDRDAVVASLDAMRAGPTKPWLARALDKGFPANGKKRPEVVRIEELVFKEADRGKPIVRIEPGYLAVIARARGKNDGADEPTMGDITTDGDDGSHTGVEVTLTEHMKGVAWWAKRFATGCGLPAAVAQDIELAARWHDAGKVDARFQRLLCGGSESRAAAATEPLAKSKIGMADPAARRRAAERSGYPRGTRHEIASVALLEAHGSLLGQAEDRDLVLHLVASHHGWCRPFAPVAEADPDPVMLKLDAEGTIACVSSDHGLEKLDAGIADRFWQLVERYGWFGLAWLEAILRLADHRRSEAEQRGDLDEKGAT